MTDDDIVADIVSQTWDDTTDGGPPFPVPGDVNVVGQPGMTLRDYLAGQALAGYMADPHMVLNDSHAYIAVAKVCYKMADAMLTARTTHE